MATPLNKPTTPGGLAVVSGGSGYIADYSSLNCSTMEGGRLELVTVNPSLVLGPVLGSDFSASVEAVAFGRLDTRVAAYGLFGRGRARHRGVAITGDDHVFGCRSTLHRRERILLDGRHGQDSQRGVGRSGAEGPDRVCAKTMRWSGPPRNFEPYRLADPEKSQRFSLCAAIRDSRRVSHSLPDG